jgi:hypothetical protein
MYRRGVVDDSELADCIKKIHVSSPFLAFQTSLAGLQIETALSTLLSYPPYFTDAVHIAIVLVQRGILKRFPISKLVHLYLTTFRAMFTPQVAIKYALTVPEELQIETISQLIVAVAENGIPALRHFVGKDRQSPEAATNGAGALTELIPSAAVRRTILSSAAECCVDNFQADRQREAAWLYEQEGMHEEALFQVVKLYTRVVSLPKESPEKKEIQDLLAMAKHNLVPAVGNKNSLYVECFNILYSLGFFFNEYHSKLYSAALDVYFHFFSSHFLSPAP